MSLTRLLGAEPDHTTGAASVGGHGLGVGLRKRVNAGRVPIIGKCAKIARNSEKTPVNHVTVFCWLMESVIVLTTFTLKENTVAPLASVTCTKSASQRGSGASDRSLRRVG